MLELLAALGILSASSLGALFHMRSKSQKEFDADRVAVSLIFPSGVTEQQVQAAIRSIGSNLRDNKLTGDPSIVFELIATERGITHQLRVPSRDASYLFGQLEVHLPGIEITPIEKLPDASYDYGLQLSLTDPGRTIRVSSAVEYATKIIKSVQTDHPGQRVTLQWIIFNTSKVKGQVSGKSSLTKALIFGVEPSKDELSDRHAKAIEQNYTAVGRIGVRAKTPDEARALAKEVLRALTSENNENRFFSKEIQFKSLDETINGANSVQVRQIQFTVSEFSAFMGWPIGDPQIPGLTQGVARRIAPTEAVARSGGRFLGWSNIHGPKLRPIHLEYDYADLNSIYAGMIGSGKSVGMANAFYDDVHTGKGGIIIDASGSESPQSLANRGLGYVPRNRVEDVIRIAVVQDADHPVAFDPLNQGAGLGAIDQIEGVFTSLYPEIASGVSVRDLLHHGLWTIIAHGGLTLVDLGALIRPKNDAEKNWANSIIKAVRDPDLREFWERMELTGRGSNDTKKKSDWERYTDPLYRRLWQLVGRPEIRNMIGQSGVGLNWEDVLTNNKIVIVSLSGLPKESAELLGSMLVQTLWTTAQRLEPEIGNGLYLDEFQVTSNIKDGLDDMLNRGRKHKLWTTLGTQFLADLPPKTKNAIYNNVGTRIVYRTSADEAAMWRRQFANDQLKEFDFIHARPHEAVAQIPNISGKSVVTIKARPPAEPTGAGPAAVHRSRQKFGTPVAQVREQIIARRIAEPVHAKPSNRKPTGKGPYDATKRDAS